MIAFKPQVICVHLKVAGLKDINSQSLVLWAMLDGNSKTLYVRDKKALQN